MTEFEKAKQYYHHKEYQTAIDLILELIGRNTITDKSIEYPDILCYLGDSRLGLYETSKNKSLVYEALTDFATGANSLLVFHQTTSSDLNKRIKKCIELV
jgi:hypothetical protein